MNNNSQNDTNCFREALANWRKSTIDRRPFEELPVVVQSHILLQAQSLKVKNMKNDIRYGFVAMSSTITGILFAFVYVFAR